MSHFNLKLSEDDINAILPALEILSVPEDSMSREEADFFTSMCRTTIFKLSHHKSLEKIDLYAIALAVDSAYKALTDNLPMDPDSKSKLNQHFFTYSKLQPQFSPILDIE